MHDPLRLKTPAEVALCVVEGSKQPQGYVMSVERILNTRLDAQVPFVFDNKERLRLDQYGKKIAMWCWATQTVPPQPAASMARAWQCHPVVIEEAMRWLDRAEAVGQYTVQEDIARCLWPEHPYYQKVLPWKQKNKLG